MGRISQFIDFINRKSIPSNEDLEVYYTHINFKDEVDDEGLIVKNKIKKARREYRLWLKKVEKNQQ
jgi:hypothetical protein